jgi:hypothetical protein
MRRVFFDPRPTYAQGEPNLAVAEPIEQQHHQAEKRRGPGKRIQLKAAGRREPAEWTGQRTRGGRGGWPGLCPRRRGREKPSPCPGRAGASGAGLEPLLMIRRVKGNEQPEDEGSPRRSQIKQGSRKTPHVITENGKYHWLVDQRNHKRNIAPQPISCSS